ARLAAHVDHAVDAGAAAQDLAARVAQGPSVETGVRLRHVEPVGARIADAAQIPHRNVDPRVVVAPTGLDQQHAPPGIRREAVGQEAARGAGAHHDEVDGLAEGYVASGQLPAAPPARAGNSLLSPSASSSTAIAARMRPIRRVITLMPVWPSTRAMRPE